MATKYLRGTVWHVSYVRAGKRVRRSTGETDESIAEQARLHYEEDEAREALSRALGRTDTIGALADAWLAASAPAWKPTTREHYRIRLGTWRKAWGDDFPLASVSVRLIEETRAARMADMKRGDKTIPGVTARTANHELKALRACLAKGVEWGHVLDNAAERVALLRPRPAQTRALTPAEVATWLKWIDDNAATEQRTFRREYDALVLSAQIRLGLHTGLRATELLGIAWEDVDLDAGVLTVPRHKSDYRGPRLLHVSPAMRDILVSLGPGAGPLWEQRDRSAFRKRIVSTARRAGIGHVTPHTLRHTYADTVRRLISDPFVLRDALGHASVSTSENYIHTAPAEMRSALDKLRW